MERQFIYWLKSNWQLYCHITVLYEKGILQHGNEHTPSEDQK